MRTPTTRVPPHARAHHASLQELEAQQKSSAMELEQMSRERSLQITEVVARAVQEQVQANLGHQSAEARQLAEENASAVSEAVTAAQQAIATTRVPNGGVT